MKKICLKKFVGGITMAFVMLSSLSAFASTGIEAYTLDVEKAAPTNSIMTEQEAPLVEDVILYTIPESPSFIDDEALDPFSIENSAGISPRAVYLKRGSYSVTGSSVRIRNTPSTSNNKIVAVAERYNTFEITGTGEIKYGDNLSWVYGWHKESNKYGYICIDYIEW